MTTETATFGSELRQWREARRLSQLELASSAEVSQRHLSFLETGRSRPSREMVIHLAATLDLPLRERNRLLVNAGFAAAYSENRLDDDSMHQLRSVLQRLLAGYEPYPAYVMDRHWNLVLANEAAARVTALALQPQSPAELLINLARFSLHPLGMRHVVVNWEQAAAQILDRIDREVAHNPRDAVLAELRAEVLGYSDVAELRRSRSLRDPAALLVPIVVDTGDLQVSLFTTIATIGAPFDVTLEELRLETLLPADAASERVLRELAATQH